MITFIAKLFTENLSAEIPQTFSHILFYCLLAKSRTNFVFVFDVAYDICVVHKMVTLIIYKLFLNIFL